MNYDRLGIKFKAVRSIGEMTELLYGLIEGKRITWYKRYHEDVDGIGGINEVLTENGYQIQSHPQLKVQDQPGFFRSLKLMFNFLSSVANNEIKWKKNISWEKVGSPKEALSLSFSKDSSERIRQYLKESKLSSTSLFLSTLDQSTSPIFLEVPSQRKWIIPITLRGVVSEIMDKRNIITTIILKFNGPLTPQFFYKDFKAFLEKKWQWGCWLYTRLQGFMGYSLTKYLASKYINDAYGLFSNLGTWPNGHIQGDLKHDMIFIPPVVRMTPVTTSLLEWNHCYQLTLMLHPCLNTNEGNLLEISHSWLENIKKITKLEELEVDQQIHQVHQILEEAL